MIDPKNWSWRDLDTHMLWMTLKFDPNKHEFHAVVFDADGVSGEHVADNPVDACAIAQYRQQQNQIVAGRYEQRRDLKGMK